MASTEELKALVRNWETAYNANDYDRLLELVAPDVVLKDVGVGESITGAAAFIEGIREAVETAAPDRQVTYTAIHVAEDDVVIAESEWWGTFIADKWGHVAGSRNGFRTCAVWRVRDGRIAEITDYTCPIEEGRAAE